MCLQFTNQCDQCKTLLTLSYTVQYSLARYSPFSYMNTYSEGSHSMAQVTVGVFSHCPSRHLMLSHPVVCSEKFSYPQCLALCLDHKVAPSSSQHALCRFCESGLLAVAPLFSIHLHCLRLCHRCLSLVSPDSSSSVQHGHCLKLFPIIPASTAHPGRELEATIELTTLFSIL